MKLETSINNQIIVKGKKITDVDWQTHLIDLKLPQRTVFSLTSKNISPTRIQWSFGDNTRIVTLTNRKHNPLQQEVSHFFREKNCQGLSTLMVQASVYTNDQIYISNEFIVEICQLKASNYVDPQVFKEQIVTFYETGYMPDDLAISVQQIAQRLSFAPNFINYSFREELVGDALIKMFQALQDQKFDPDKGNPFSYFTKIAFHAFCNRIKTEKKINNTHNEYQEFVYHSLLNGYKQPTHNHSDDYGDDF